MSADIEKTLANIRTLAIRRNSPERKNGFSLGDAVKLPNMPTVFEVIGLADESLVDLRAPSGCLLKAGWRTLTRVKIRENDQ